MSGAGSGRSQNTCCPQGKRLQGVYNSGDQLPINHQLFVLLVTRIRAGFSAQAC